MSKVAEAWTCRSQVTAPASAPVAAPVAAPGPPRLSDLTIALVLTFYERDDISLLSPAVRDCLKAPTPSGEPVTVQKRYLCLTVAETFAMFKDENEDVQLGLTKFKELRPQHVRIQAEIPKNICVCAIHFNFFRYIIIWYEYVYILTARALCAIPLYLSVP
jgi:hypothetical protein